MKNHLLLTPRKFLFAILVFSIMLLYPLTFVHAEGSMNVTEMSGTAIVGNSKLNIRSGPGKDYSALGSASPGEMLTITGQSNSWYRIDYNGQEGYVSSKYVTLSSDDAEASSVVNDPNDFSNYEEGSSQHDNIFTALSPKLLILVAILILVVIIMVTTFIMIRKSNDEEEYEDEEYEEDDEEYEEDDEEDEEYDEEDEEYDEEDEEYTRRQHIPTKKRNSHAPSSDLSTPKKEAKITSNRTITEEDYRLDIDPRIFEEEPTFEKAPAIDKKTQELDAAMSKLEELQQEIERLKNS